MANILFIGDMNEWGRTAQRARALSRLGHTVRCYSTVPVPFQAGIDTESLLTRALWKLGIPHDSTATNDAVIHAAAREQFQIVWADKAMTLRPSTMRTLRRMLPGVKLVWCAEDDMFARHNQTRWFLRSLPLYDLVFTTKVYNLTELTLLGARRVELFLDAYDETLHRPVDLTRADCEQFGCDVGFVGTCEEDRAAQVFHLAESGVSVVVWGNGWGGWVNRHPNLIIKNRPVYGEEYVKAINATKINLSFLRKMNRDEVTSRSVEIPACGAFMLAERTERHLRLFEEGKEAAFFSTRDELLESVRFFLKNDEVRSRVAAAGRQRCETSGYSMREQLERMLRAAQDIGGAL